MSFKIKQNGIVKDLKLPASSIQLLDMDDNYTTNNLEEVLQELGEADSIYISDDEPDKDGVWISNENIAQTGENKTFNALKDYIEENVTPQIQQNTNTINELSNPNLLINGDFQVWGSSPTVTHTSGNLVYVDGKWAVYRGSVTKIEIGVKLVQTTLDVNSTFRQYIKNFIYLKGKTVTLSTNVTQLKNCCNIYINAVRSEDGVAEVLAIGNRITTSGKYSLTVTMPNDLSKYKEMYVSIQSYNLATLNQTELSFAQFEYMKLELGDRATPLYPKLQHEEILACNDGIIGNNPNLLINGDFQVWQRGTSFNITQSNNTYTADRWKTHHINTNVSQQLTGSAELSKYCIRVLNKGTTNGQMYLMQFFENDLIDTLTDQTLTLSFWVRGVNNATNTIGCRIGSTGGRSITINNSWQKCVLTTQGVQFDKSSPYNKGIIIYSISASPFDVDKGFEIANVKLELGTVATPFVPRTYGEELALCQRYYEAGNNTFNGIVVDASSCRGHLPFMVNKRVTPSVTLFNEYNSTNCVVINGSWVSGVNLGYIDTVGSITLSKSNGFVGSEGKFWTCMWKADAEIY